MPVPKKKFKGREHWRNYPAPLSVRLPDDVKAALARAADEQDTTTSQVLATLAARWVRQYRRKKREGRLRPSRSATRRIIYRPVAL